MVKRVFNLTKELVLDIGKDYSSKGNFPPLFSNSRMLCGSKIEVYIRKETTKVALANQIFFGEFLPKSYL